MRFIIALALALLTVFAFARVVDLQFLNYDDPGYVTRNAHVRAGLTWNTVAWSFTTFEQGNYHPVTWLSHALDCTLFGLNPAYHHAMNLVYHTASVVLLFLLFFRMTGALWRSAFVAAVFAIHPLHVESVAWVAERKDVLSGLFFMLVLHAYLSYRENPVFLRAVLLLVLFALGLLAKPMLVTLPFVILLLEWWPLNGGEPVRADNMLSRGRKILPMFALSAISSVLTFIVQRAGGSMAFAAEVGTGDRLLNALVSYVRYLRDTLVPVDLAIFYPYPAGGTPMLPVILSGVLIVGVSVLVWRYRARSPYLMTGWLWYAGMLVPVVGLIQVGMQERADRYMYIPIIGLAIMAAWGTPALLRNLPRRKYILGAAAALLVGGMVIGTRAQTQYWKDSTSVFGHALAVTKDNHIAHNNLGALLEDSGRHAEALAHLREAVRLRPDEVLIRRNLARTLVSLGRRAEALKEYEWILARIPPDPELYARMGDLLADEGRTDEAAADYRQALLLDPAHGAVRYKLAELYLRASQLQLAQQVIQEAMRQAPQASWPHDLRGVIEAKLGRTDEALAAFRRSLELDSTNGEAYNDLGTLYDRMGRPDDALAMFTDAVRWSPQLATAQFNLATSLAVHRRYGEAEAHWLKSLEIDSTSLDAHLNLGRLYMMQGRIADALLQYRHSVKIDSANVQAHYNIALIFEREGRFADALEEFRKVRALDPGFAGAEEAIRRVDSKSGRTGH